MTDLAQSSSKRLLRIVSKCTTEDELIAVFSRFSAANDTLFIVTRTPKPVGFVARIKIALAGGEVMVDGSGEVVGSVPAGGDQRPGMVLRLSDLAGKSRAILDRMSEVRKAEREGASIDEATTPAATLGELIGANAAEAKPAPTLPRLSDVTRDGKRKKREDQTPLPEPMPLSELLPAVPKADAPAAETRAPSSSYVLPANPLGELPDGSIEGFIECALYEESASSESASGDGDESDSGAGKEVNGFANTLLAMDAAEAPAAAPGGKAMARGKRKEPEHAKTLNIAALPKVKPRPRVVRPPGADGGRQPRVVRAPSGPADTNRRPLPGVGPAPGDPPPIPGAVQAMATASARPRPPGHASRHVTTERPQQSRAAALASALLTPRPGSDDLPLWKRPRVLQIAVAAAVVVLVLAIIGFATCGDDDSAAHTVAIDAAPVAAAADPKAAAGEADSAGAKDKTAPDETEGTAANTTAADEAAENTTPEASDETAETTAPASDETVDTTAPDEATDNNAAGETKDELAPGQCRVAFTSRPNHATVSVDGKRVGKTPISKVLPCQTIKVEMDHPRWEAEQRKVRLKEGETNNVKMGLSRPMVTLWVLSMPPGATLWVHGHKVGKTPTKIQVRGFERAPLKVKKSGYKTWQQTVRPTGKKTLKVRLQKR
ncbi:MAG TPA: PEGA domain-containing protein [Kofleriaceae bacterium]|nr:PEGA domain-containing protein [Kofleriaceae bacterium]